MPRPRIPARRDAIVSAARDLILDQGWPATTVADIAGRAGVGKGAVYLEFPDKSAILAAVLTASVRRVVVEVRRRVLGAPVTVDLPTVYRFGLEALLGDRLLCAAYTHDTTILGEHVKHIADDRYAQRTSWLDDYVIRLQQAGVVDPALSATAIGRMLAVFSLGLVHAPGTLGTADPDDLAATVGIFAELLSRGLSAGGSTDPVAAREAQLDLLDALEEQINELEESQ
ncbi:helix-turn-helix domain-containing protein [Nocardia sp. NPDC051990]|uniref:TetR/AcrR family transcriptional regulator n=1 Tax=Nocardia sp. NPDC051990 TaxID=3155285 RepID=UPI0034320ABB